MIDGLDDEVLLAALRHAISSRRAVPPEWVALIDAVTVEPLGAAV